MALHDHRGKTAAGRWWKARIAWLLPAFRGNEGFFHPPDVVWEDSAELGGTVIARPEYDIIAKRQVTNVTVLATMYIGRSFVFSNESRMSGLNPAVRVLPYNAQRSNKWKYYLYEELLLRHCCRE